MDDVATMKAEIAYYRAALRGLRGLAVLEATESDAWRKAVVQIDEVLEGPLPSTLVGTFAISNDDEPYGPRDGERDDMPTLREERELRDAKLDDPRRGCVPPYFKR